MRLLAITSVLLSGLLPLAAAAAGGHHSVDDAVVLEPGQCELETWVARNDAGQQVAHAGPGCRLGPIELSGVTERGVGPKVRLRSLQAKAVTEVGNGWAIGVAAGPSLVSGTAPSRALNLLLLATWVRDPWTVHLNLGRDVVRGGPDQARRGASVEWLAGPSWQLLAERYEERGTHFARGGLRYMPTPTWQLDLSRAHNLHGPAPSLWTLGSTWQFGS